MAVGWIGRYLLRYDAVTWIVRCFSPFFGIVETGRCLWLRDETTVYEEIYSSTLELASLRAFSSPTAGILPSNEGILS